MAIEQYKCQWGQTWTDVVMNTYGTMDLYVKFMNDNAVTPNSLPYSNQSVIFDSALLNDETTTALINNNDIVYSTGVNSAIPSQPQPVSTYQQTQPQATYTASNPSGEIVLTIAAIASNPGGTIIGVQKGINPLLPSKYNANMTTGVITLLGGEILAYKETLFVTWSLPATTT